MKPSFELTSQQRYDIVTYRIENAQKTLGEIKDLVALKYYNTAANRMYYACYYAASALLIANGIATKSHDGVKQMFGLHFIKRGVLPMHLSSIYSQPYSKDACLATTTICLTTPLSRLQNYTQKRKSSSPPSRRKLTNG